MLPLHQIPPMSRFRFISRDRLCWPVESADLEVRVRVFRQGTRPSHDEMIRDIEEHKDQFPVEALCRVLRPAVSGFLTSHVYRAAITRPTSARRLRDDLLVPEAVWLHAANYGVYGRRKMHRKELNRLERQNMDRLRTIDRGLDWSRLCAGNHGRGLLRVWLSPEAEGG
jgi:hypothetical protein